MVEVLIVFMALLQSHLSLFHLLQNLFSEKVLQKCCTNDLNVWVMPATPHKYWVFRHIITPSDYSHSIVAGGLLVISYTIRFMPCTSFVIREEIFVRISYGICAYSHVIKSLVRTARSASV